MHTTSETRTYACCDCHAVPLRSTGADPVSIAAPLRAPFTEGMSFSHSPSSLPIAPLSLSLSCSPFSPSFPIAHTIHIIVPPGSNLPPLLSKVVTAALSHRFAHRLGLTKEEQEGKKGERE